jgi:hypothetical protein
VTANATTRQLVAKLWNYCDVLRDDGVSTIDYVEQLHCPKPKVDLRWFVPMWGLACDAGHYVGVMSGT